MIVESMKMENEVVAPEGGRIASIAVAAGSAINTGDLAVHSRLKALTALCLMRRYCFVCLSQCNSAAFLQHF